MPKNISKQQLKKKQTEEDELLNFYINENKNVKSNIEELTPIAKNFSLLLETIDRVSNKLFVNWLNTIPFTLKNYTKSNLFKNSIKLVSKESTNIDNLFINSKLIPTPNLQLKSTYFVPNHRLNTTDLSIDTLPNIFEIYDEKNDYTTIKQENLIQNRGISIGDIFNTIHTDLFMDILYIKWLIYQSTFENNDMDEIYIKKFNDKLAIPGMYLGLKWNELIVDQQLSFISKWNSLKNIVYISSADQKKGYFNLLYNIIIFMERNYNKIDSIIKIYYYNRITIDTDFDVIDNDDVNDNESYEIIITPQELIDRIKVIPIEDIYTYLCETIQKFMMTW